MVSKKKIKKLRTQAENIQYESGDDRDDELVIEVVPSRGEDLKDWPGGKEEVSESEGLIIKTKYVDMETAKKYMRGEIIDGKPKENSRETAST